MDDVGVQGDGAVGREPAEQVDGPLTPHRGQGGLHQRWHAGSNDDGVHSQTVAGLQHSALDVVPRGVEGEAGAEQFGLLETTLVHLTDDDRGGAHGTGQHQVEEAHGAGAQQEERSSRRQAAGLQRIEDAGQRLREGGYVRRQPLRHWKHVTEGNDGGGYEKQLGQAAVLIVTQGGALQAAVTQTAQAVEAAATGDDRAESHALPLRQAVDIFAELGDDADVLVAGYDADLGLLLSLVDADIGLAEAGRFHTQEQLAGAGLGFGYRLHADVAGAVEDAGLHSAVMTF